MSFSRGPNPIWFMSNLTGQPLDDTYYAFFLTNTLPYIPQAVYSDPNGTIPWSDPIEFQPSSGLPNNLFFNDDLVYRIEVRKGPTQTDPLIWLVENYTTGQGNNAGQDFFVERDNLITNPQFADQYFNNTVTYTTAGTYEIAPGWELVLSGSGSTTVTLRENPGQGYLTNLSPYAPYYLDFLSSGWTSVILQQTFSNNGAIFQKGAIALALTAISNSGGNTLTVNYTPFNGSTALTAIPLMTGQVISPAVLTQYLPGYTNIPASLNPAFGTAASVKIQFSLPVNGSMGLTNIYLIGQNDPIPAGSIVAQPTFEQETYERQVDHEFHVYRQSLLREPKNSILVGWNFGLNPWQFRTTVSTNIAVNQYVCDQTILIQQNYVANNVGNNVAAGQASFMNLNNGLEIVAVTAHNQFGILQYIAAQSVRPYWGKIVSLAVNAQFFTSIGTNLQFKVRLVYKAGLPNTVSRVDPISSWTELGDPVAATGYTLIVPPNDPTYTLSNVEGYVNFDGISLPNSSNANMTLGVLVYTINNMGLSGTGDAIVFNDISLVNNDFALPTQPQTFDEVLRECQFYYETSYNLGIVEGTVSIAGQQSLTVPLSPTLSAGSYSTNELYRRSFQVNFKVIKRGNPAMTFYSPDSTSSGQVQMQILNGNGTVGTTSDQPISGWTAVGLCQTSVTMVPNDNTAVSTGYAYGSAEQGVITYHYSANSLLGL